LELLKKRKNLIFYNPLLVWPALILFAVFFLAPSLAGFYYAFTDWSPYNRPLNFVGLNNFARIFREPISVKALQNTLIYAVTTTVFKNVIGLLLALALNMRLKTRNITRAIYFMPAILCSIIVGLLFNSILHPTKGLLNNLLNDAGLGFLKQNWLTDTKIVMYTISAVEIWQWSGFHMAIYLAGLQGVPTDLKESMLIDGANGWQRFRYLTFPFILPSFNINLITSLIGGFKVFDMVFLLTNGGPGFASQVVGVLIYKAFGDGFWGLGTAYSILQFAVIMIVSATILSYLRTKEIEA